MLDLQALRVLTARPEPIQPFPARKDPQAKRVPLASKAHRAIRDLWVLPGPMVLRVQKVQRDRKGRLDPRANPEPLEEFQQGSS